MAVCYTQDMALVRFMLRLPEDLKRWLDQKAKGENRTATNYVVNLLAMEKHKDEEKEEK
jgi:hypothetical protein